MGTWKKMKCTTAEILCSMGTCFMEHRLLRLSRSLDVGIRTVRISTDYCEDGNVNSFGRVLVVIVDIDHE